MSLGRFSCYKVLDILDVAVNIILHLLQPVITLGIGSDHGGDAERIGVTDGQLVADDMIPLLLPLLIGDDNVGEDHSARLKVLEGAVHTTMLSA